MKMIFALAACVLCLRSLATFGGTVPDPRLLAAANTAYATQRGAVSNTRYLTLIDYRKSIFQTRLWVIDRQTKKVVLSSRVSHAFRSGLLYASSFSNAQNSEKSCAGSFVTGSTYKGKFGYSLRIKGLDASNSNALSRSVIFHSAKYGNPFTKGCFATEPAINTQLINLIKGGSFVYVSR